MLVSWLCDLDAILEQFWGTIFDFGKSVPDGKGLVGHGGRLSWMSLVCIESMIVV